MRPTARATHSERNGGFTLIEMMAVMMIIALVAGLAVTMTPGTGRPRLEAVALQTAALFRRERLGAILTARDRVVRNRGETLPCGGCL